ncbi:hypothetical protein FQZ97_914510 [compost metagenome]
MSQRSATRGASSARRRRRTKWSTSTTPNSGANTEPINSRKFWYSASGASPAITVHNKPMARARCSTLSGARMPTETAAEWMSAKAFSDSSSRISSSGMPSPAPASASSRVLASAPLAANARV